MKKIILFLLINTFFISQYPILAIDGHRLHNYLRSKDKWVQSSGLTYLEGVGKGLGKALNILARSNTLKNELGYSTLDLIFLFQKTINICPPSGTNTLREIEVVEEFLKNNKTIRKQDGADIYFLAMQDRFPCSENYFNQIRKKFKK